VQSAEELWTCKACVNSLIFTQTACFNLAVKVSIEACNFELTVQELVEKATCDDSIQKNIYSGCVSRQLL